MSFYDNVLKYLKECKVALADRFAPYFTIGVCNHIVNLENQKREFYLEHGRVANLRTHVFMCAPPGFTKTLYLEKFLKGKTSIVGGSAFVNCGFEGSMTEAGFTGTVKVVNGEPVEVKGAAYENRMSIMGIDEFASLTNAMRQEHSINLDNAMLTALDSGFLIKRLALGKIQYITQLTLFTGSQPMRFNLTSGLGRRFIYIWFIPTKDEEGLIRKSRREAKNYVSDLSIVSSLKDDLKKVATSCQTIERVKFDGGIYKLFDKIHVPHFEETLYERMAIGYTLARDNGADKTLEVSVDSTLRELFERANNWRLEIKKGAETSQVYQVVKEMTGSTVSQVKRRLTDLGLAYSQSTHILNILEKQGRIRYVKERAAKGGRPRTLIVAAEN